MKSICIDDYSYSFCKGCRACHDTAECVMSDAAHLGLTSVECKEDVEPRRQEIIDFCGNI